MSNLPSMRRGQPQLRSRQQGAIAIVVGLALAVLVGFVGLALDTASCTSPRANCRTAPIPAPSPQPAT